MRLEGRLGLRGVPRAEARRLGSHVVPGGVMAAEDWLV